MFVHKFWWQDMCICVGDVCRSEMAGSWEMDMFTLSKSAKQFSKVVIPIYMPTCGMWECQLSTLGIENLTPLILAFLVNV